MHTTLKLLLGLVLVAALRGVVGLPRLLASNDKASTVDVEQVRQSLAESARTSKGDPARGRDLYRALTCIGCHAAEGSGGRMGPDLSSVGDRLDGSKLIQKILRPSDWIAKGYQKASVTFESGKIVRGVYLGETATHLQLKVRGQIREISKAEVDNWALIRESDMPEGLVDHLTGPQFTDLIAYLVQLQVSKGKTLN